MKEKIYSLLDDIKSLASKNPEEYTLPDNVCYLNDTDILCLERYSGESRYPYEMDGLNLWVHSTGHICANESNFVIFRTASQQEEPSVEFRGGIKKDGEWVPVSITGATYIHATMFAVMALFIIGEGERAWEQIFKVLPITHKTVTKTPFIMPNCYYYNEDYKLDGQSAGDWYTGSGAVLMRCIIEHAMGFLAYPEGLKIAPPDYMPSDEITMKIFLKGSNITFRYTNKNSGTREYFVNGAKHEKLYDEVSASEYIRLKNDEISGNMVIEVVD